MELVSISSRDSGSTCNVVDIALPPPSAGSEVEVKGTTIQLVYNDKYDVNAFILSGRLIALPRHVRDNLLPLISNAHEIDIKGIERNDSDGFVNVRGLNL